jgi:LPS-assembly protein
MSYTISNTNVLMEQNAVAWALTNKVTARVKNKNGAPSYLELLRLKLFQVYDINEAKKDMAGSTTDRRPMSDFGIELDLKPHPYFSFAARNKYSVYSGWKEMNYDLGISDWRGDKLTFGYRYTMDSIEEINLDLKAVITERLSGKLVVRLDQFNNQTVENTVGLTYTEQCWGVGVDYTKTHDDDRIMLKISLAGLGMF